MIAYVTGLGVLHDLFVYLFMFLFILYRIILPSWYLSGIAVKKRSNYLDTGAQLSRVGAITLQSLITVNYVPKNTIIITITVGIKSYI